MIEICAATEVGVLKLNSEVKLVVSHSAADLEGYELVMNRITNAEKNGWEEIAECQSIRQVSGNDFYVIESLGRRMRSFEGVCRMIWLLK